MNPFEFVNSINDTKEDIMVDEDMEKAYNSYIVNRALSYFPDTVLFANEVNQYPYIDNRLKYDFLRYAVRRRKRFSKWFKNETDKEIEIIKEYYGYSTDKARQVANLISEEDLIQMKNKLSKGGLL